MSGHSHWANVRYKKEREDKKRGKLFSRISRQIIQAVREGGSDPEFNLSLKSAIEEARSANMPKERIERAIKAGEREGGSGSLEILEGYGPGGVAVLLRVQTDNKNRTVGEIRRLFEHLGGSLGDAGSSAYIFPGGEPQFELELSGEDRERFTTLLAELEAHPDVVKVLHNAKI